MIRIYVDMDGVIADFDKKMQEKGLNGDTLKLMKGIYEELEVIEGAREAISKLRDYGYDIHVATKIPDHNAFAATEKLTWLRNHIPELLPNVTITPDKGQLGNDGDYLIDDRPHKANVSSFKGTVLFFGSNGIFNNWDDILDYFEKLNSQLKLTF